MAKLLFSKLKQSDNGLYILSTLTITMTWILVLYVKAAAVGIIASIENGQSEFIDSLIGFTIYQLWVYLGLGFIHGIISGIFLTIDLKKNIKKINKTALNNK